MPGLPEALGAQLGIDVFVADPTVRLRGTESDLLAPHRSSAAVSLGLSLGAA